LLGNSALHVQRRDRHGQPDAGAAGAEGGGVQSWRRQIDVHAVPHQGGLNGAAALPRDQLITGQGEGEHHFQGRPQHRRRHGHAARPRRAQHQAGAGPQRLPSRCRTQPAAATRPQEFPQAARPHWRHFLALQYWNRKQFISSEETKIFN